MANDGRALSTLDEWKHMDGPVTRGMLRRVILIQPCDVVVVCPRCVLDDAELKQIWDEAAKASGTHTVDEDEDEWAAEEREFERMQREKAAAQARLVRKLNAAYTEDD